MMKQLFTILIIFMIINSGFAQKKVYQSLEKPIMTDSNSTLMIPIEYSASIFSSNKLVAWNEYYANIIFFDFKKDSSRKLFPQDTYIKGFRSYYGSNSWSGPTQKHDFGGKWIFYFVKSTDYNMNGKIDDNDPSILYASDKYGKGLKAITPAEENVEEIYIYEKQGFALLKMQIDSNKDRSFQSGDQDFYYVKLDLKTLTLGSKIRG